MDRETMAFGFPVVGMLVTLVLLGVGLFLGGLTPLTIFAGVFGALCVLVLAASVAALD